MLPVSKAAFETDIDEAIAAINAMAEQRNLAHSSLQIAKGLLPLPNATSDFVLQALYGESGGGDDAHGTAQQ